MYHCIAATGVATCHKVLHLRLIGMPNLQSEKKYADNAATLNSLITGEFPTGWADALSVRITYLCTILQLVLMCGGLYSNG